MDKLKYERLKQIIKNNIRDAIWRPGDKIPVDKILCEQFGVSRITVKKAKDDLIAEGVLENLPGRRGAFVRKKNRGLSTDLIGVVIESIEVFPGISINIKSCSFSWTGLNIGN